MKIYMNTIGVDNPNAENRKWEKIRYFLKEMDDDIRLILESWAHTEKWDECFKSYRTGVETLFNLNYPAITRHIDFLRNKQGAGEIGIIYEYRDISNLAMTTFLSTSLSRCF